MPFENQILYFIHFEITICSKLSNIKTYFNNLPSLGFCTVQHAYTHHMHECIKRLYNMIHTKK